MSDAKQNINFYLNFNDNQIIILTSNFIPNIHFLLTDILLYVCQRFVTNWPCSGLHGQRIEYVILLQCNAL